MKIQKRNLVKEKENFDKVMKIISPFLSTCKKNKEFENGKWTKNQQTRNSIKVEIYSD